VIKLFWINKDNFLILKGKKLIKNTGGAEYDCQGFHFFDEMPEPALQIESIGREPSRSTLPPYTHLVLRAPECCII
jgi:hypothetical protein